MSALKCQPGDIARIVNASEPHASANGNLVEVLYLAPAHDFKLPDGYLSVAGSGEHWVARLIGWNLRADLEDGATRVAQYGMILDRFLEPIRPQHQRETKRTDEVSA